MTASHIVPPSKIQAELNSMWSSLDNKNKMRASLFNLIFYSKKSSRDEYTRKIAQKIIEKFPARIFFISSDPETNDSPVKTAVSIMSAEQGEFEITCDFIEVAVTKETENQVPFIILPHIIPDLPIFLVWAEDPTHNTPLLQELQKFATRLIFDSETAEDLPGFAKSILKMKTDSNCEIADLNWARLESWRDLLSAVFKEPANLNKLRKIRSLKITYNAHETPFFCHTRIQSIYLQSWLACRLQWTLEKSDVKNDIMNFSYLNMAKEKISVTIQSQRYAQLPPGLIISLELSRGPPREIEDQESPKAASVTDF